MTNKHEQVRPGLWCVQSAIPYGPLKSTLSYALLGDDGVHIIDPGWESDGNAALWRAVLAELGRSVAEVRTVIVTHHHPDHIGLAEWFRRESGARVVMSAIEVEVLAAVSHPAQRDAAAYRRRLDAWAVPESRRDELMEVFTASSPAGEIIADVTVHDGDTIAVGGRELRVVLTPGHTSGHICLVSSADEVIFTGDHILPDIYSGLGLGTLDGREPVSEMVDALDLLAPFDDYEVLPGHLRRFRGLQERRTRIAAHHLRRLAEVASLVPELGDAPVWEYARRLTWTLGWDGLKSFALHSALHQTELHLHAARSDGGNRLVVRALSSG